MSDLQGQLDDAPLVYVRLLVEQLILLDPRPDPRTGRNGRLLDVQLWRAAHVCEVDVGRLVGK